MGLAFCLEKLPNLWRSEKGLRGSVMWFIRQVAASFNFYNVLAIFYCGPTVGIYVVPLIILITFGICLFKLYELVVLITNGLNADAEDDSGEGQSDSASTTQ